MTVVYLDHHATTPCDPAVVDAMLPWFTERFGNAGSGHAAGMIAEAAVDRARRQLAEAIGGSADEIVWTSGATESDNLALLGVAEAASARGHVITGATEHHAVLDPVHHLEAHGWRVTRLTPDADGRIHPEQVGDALRDDTVLVSLMLANNEIGTVHPIGAIAAVCHERGVLVHTDAAQALGHVPVDVRALGVDLVSLSGHKAYGPKGIGALWIRRRGRPLVALAPRQLGGGQERGLRSGTLPVPLIVGMGEAAAIAERERVAGEPARLAALRDRLWAQLAQVDGAHRHTPTAEALPHNLNVRFDGVASDLLQLALRADVALSGGSACSTGSTGPSHVLTAIGLDAAQARGAVRFGLGRATTEADVDRVAEAVASAVRTLRARTRTR